MAWCKASPVGPSAAVVYRPLPAGPGDKAPSADGWAHEIKHDGYRLQLHLRDGRVRLFRMTGVDWTDRYPRIVESVARLQGCAK